ncbi:hypothetical protein GCM10010112_53180 [Actinoplanes lobatus]|uniref:Uncharacterized protein n=1 Tax=Actinoplanes lobatus TaxID=113568 RepID=A0A7W7HB97_9ACTN|nr:hypothetical protein [Actinoplanes lobatus]MBB4747399.1 hypothetical protein [Actinoplanes lobatus]GGN79012.1 hypothetical protein GCM10010112_53180 [Actinoplanes lobatus]GIE42631.1 hypothetical protein Alo02nite_55290 [Actinoplanes lobatus]
MTAVTEAGRRRWLIGGVTAWAVLLLGGGLWSVRSDPPTVPEQRDAGQALPVLREAAGAVVSAAQGGEWALRLGELRVEECALTPAWDGVELSREVTVYVPEGEAHAALDGIAAGLPAGYRAGMTVARGATRLSLFADAGEFVGIAAEASSADQVLRILISSGCRPGVERLDRADPASGPAPELLTGTLAALSGPGPAESGGDPADDGPSPADDGPGTMEIRAVACPDGGIAATFVAGGGAAQPDSQPVGVPEGTLPVWVEPGAWAYRIGSESVVVTTEGGRWQVSLTTGCRQ